MDAIHEATGGQAGTNGLKIKTLYHGINLALEIKIRFKHFSSIQGWLRRVSGCSKRTEGNHVIFQALPSKMKTISSVFS